MANLCENTLLIHGSDARIDALIQAHLQAADQDGPVLAFETVRPIPPDLLARRPHPDAMSNDEYLWRLHTWGCQWSPTASRAQREVGRLWMRFDTPDSPPHGTIRHLAELHPELQFTLGHRDEDTDDYGLLYAIGHRAEEDAVAFEHPEALERLRAFMAMEEAPDFPEHLLEQDPYLPAPRERNLRCARRRKRTSWRSVTR